MQMTDDSTLQVKPSFIWQNWINVWGFFTRVFCHKCILYQKIMKLNGNSEQINAYLYIQPFPVLMGTLPTINLSRPQTVRHCELGSLLQFDLFIVKPNPSDSRRKLMLLFTSCYVTEDLSRIRLADFLLLRETRSFTYFTMKNSCRVQLPVVNLERTSYLFHNMYCNLEQQACGS